MKNIKNQNAKIKMKEDLFIKKLAKLIFFASFLMGCTATSLVPETNDQVSGKSGDADTQSDFEPANGQTRYPIDLDTCLRLATNRPLDIAASRAALDEAQAQAILASERFLPVLSPGFRFWRLEGLTQGTEGNFVNVEKQNSFAGAALNLKWPLGDAIFSALSAKKKYEAAQFFLEGTSREVLLKTAKAYFDLVKEDQMAQTLKLSVEISEKLLRETEALVTNGRGFQGDLLRVKAQWGHNQLEWLKAQNALKQTSNQLILLLNLDPRVELYSAQEKMIPVQMVSEKDLEKLLKLAHQSRPEVEEAKEKLQATLYEKKGATWGPLIPEINLETSWGGFGSVPSHWEDQEIDQAMIQWKIGPGGLLDMGRSKLLSAQARAAEIKLDQVLKKIGHEVKSFYDQSQSLEEQMKIAEQGVKDAQESLALNEERQVAGLGLPLEVIQAEESLTRARLDYLNVITEYNKAQFELLMSTGNLPGENSK
ncbi:MAG: TolC family protein [Chlamydiae bacterium]|nr:TolC family protein [Chlamydiota bacterium]